MGEARRPSRAPARGVAADLHGSQPWRRRGFSTDNLVPTPRPELWQDAPHSRLEELQTPQAQGRLAVCQLISSMEESRVNVGVATYASATGDVNFRRPSAIAPPLRRTYDFGTLPGRTRRDGVEARARRLRGVRECSWGEGARFCERQRV